MTITEMLARNARLLPNATALIEITPSKNLRKVITWKEFDNNANRFANALVDMGVMPGDRVSLFLENCPQFVIAFHGALKAGAVVVPANPMFKEMELEYELNDSGARVMVTLDHLYPMVERIRSRVSLDHVIVTSYHDHLPQ